MKFLAAASTATAEGQEGASSAELDDMEAEEVEAHLRGLGYLE